ncbi:unnamed protein product [Clonostachys byssicola]|uniref:Protein kinase domain-containing protein n=1 Tax=Clonostachys byssicola TaxID=160290 RepID=A0A9N9U6E0_9HYPO|nr:unnamed protein product [Clonostachys byssicola]
MSKVPLEFSEIIASKRKNPDGKHDPSFYEAFVPAGDITKLATKDAVIVELSKEGMSKELEETAEKVVADAPKVFLTLVCTGGHSFIRVLTHPLNDKKLFDHEIQATTKVYGKFNGEWDRDSRIPSRLMHRDGKPVMTFSEHDHFYIKHWIFQAPVFESDNTELMYDFHWLQPLPYLVPKKTLVINSGFSTVRKTLIHPDHYKFETSYHWPSSPEGMNVAVKTLRANTNKESGTDTEKFYEIEAETLKKMGALNDAHLIRSVAIYKRGTERCFVFPWAEGGNLDDFWYNYKDKRDDDLIRWAINQMLGLFGGLDKLHEENIRHGDVKPPNILHFPNSSSQLGQLVLADVGLAKFHTDYTKDRQKITSTKHSTEDYEPPEPLNEKISRYYDNWSIGCVFIEFLIWIKSGYDELCNFRRALEYDDQKRKRFWQRKDRKRFWQLKFGKERNAFVHPEVDKWVEKLRWSKYPIVYDLADLVRKNMLVPDPNQRRTLNNGLLYKFKEICATLALNEGKLSPENPSKAGHVAGGHADLDPKPEAESSTQSFTRNASNLYAAGDRQLTKQIINRIGWSFHCPPTRDTNLCQVCRIMDFEQPEWELGRNVDELKGSATSCALCQFFFNCLSNSLDERKPITLYRDDASFSLRLSPYGRSLITIYSDPNSKSENQPYSSPGLPRLPIIGSSNQYQLFNEWIKTCDNNHDCFPKAGTIRKHDSALPTRLLNVGSDQIRLEEPRKLAQQKYVALSHRWGDRSTHSQFCTYDSNIERFRTNIPFTSMPKTFQDAVKVTRAIGVQYLWIDSLCIIQGNADDWETESSRMEDVFSSAYCVIAATSAASSLEGFLNYRQPRPCVTVQAKEGPLHLAKAIDNFQDDVEHGLLNTRGWVLQERVLARRTIHFTSTQVYWECGQGVHCETLAQLHNTQSQFLGDSNFPHSSLEYYKDERIRLVQHLYEFYSTLDLTNESDRSKAILGIETRLARFFKSRSHYGIFEKSFHRMLLWQAKSPGGLAAIPQPKEPSKRTPSWSWMSRTGKIQFMDIPFGSATWLEILPGPISSDNIDITTIHAEAHGLLSEDIESMGDVVLDSEDCHYNRKTWKCVKLGHKKLDDLVVAAEHYYILLIRPISDMCPGSYERVGAGRIKHSDLSPEKPISVEIS